MIEMNLEWVADARIEVSEPILIGPTPAGIQQVYPVGGGTVIGPNLKAIVVPGAADWQVIRRDGVTTLDVTGAFVTDDNVTCRISTKALYHELNAGAERESGDTVAANTVYMRGVSRFYAPNGKYSWLNSHLHVMWGEPTDIGVTIHYYRVA